jgi:large subunit ribosomal protein L21
MRVYAVVETGGKQYRLEPGQTMQVEHLPGGEGDEVVLERVLLVAQEGEVRLGTPWVEGARVRCRIVQQGRHPKILVFKYKPKANYRRRQGHRQPFTRLRVETIEVGAPTGGEGLKPAGGKA